MIKMTPLLAEAIIEVDDDCYNESLGLANTNIRAAWTELLTLAEEIAGRRAYRTLFHKELKIKNPES